MPCLNSALNPRTGHPPAEGAPAGLVAEEECVIGGPPTSGAVSLPGSSPFYLSSCLSLYEMC